MIISQNSNDVYYAYTRGRFWRWDESARVWKESHLLAQKFGKAKTAEKRLTPEAFLTSDEFIPMDDYELPQSMLTALREAKPCKNAPVDPVEEEPEVPGTQTAQEKPLTTVPDAMRPAFDYSGLTDQTVEDLHFAENEYRHGKQMAERGLVHMGNAIAAAMMRCAAPLSHNATTVSSPKKKIPSGRGACPSASPRIPLTGCCRSRHCWTEAAPASRRS